MFKTQGIITIVSLASFIVMVGLAMIRKVWSMDTEAAGQYRRLVTLVRRANKGDVVAQNECNTEPDIKKTTRCTARFDFEDHYSVRRSALYACFNK